MGTVTYDPTEDILYVRLSDESVADTVCLDDLRIIDYSVDGGVIGIEFIGASGGVELRDIPFSHKVEELIRDHGLALPIYA